MHIDQAIEKAREIGTEHGTAAASWVTDGNTDPETYRRLLAGIEDGDPEIMDELPHADLSGEWADGYTPRQLVEDCDLDADEVEAEDGTRLISVETELCDAYEEAFSVAVEAEIVRACRYQLT